MVERDTTGHQTGEPLRTPPALSDGETEGPGVDCVADFLHIKLLHSCIKPNTSEESRSWGMKTEPVHSGVDDCEWMEVDWTTGGAGWTLDNWQVVRQGYNRDGLLVARA